MSAASLLKVYDGQDPELAFPTAAGGVPTLAQVLGAGAAAGNIAMTALGDLTFGTGDTITGPAGANLSISAAATRGLILTGENGASLTATTGGCKVESTAGVLELNAADAAGELNIVLDAAKLTAFTISASNAPTYAGAVRQLQIQVGGVNYWLALNPAAFA